MIGPDGATSAAATGRVVRSVACSDGWRRHDLEDSAFCIYERPRGKTRFQVLERGAGPRGTARKRGTARSLTDAVTLAQSLSPTSPAEVLADVAVVSDEDRRSLDRLARLAEPGTRLWVRPIYGEHGYRGCGEAATALGLAVLGVETLFGLAHRCWLIRYRTDSGREDSIGEAACCTYQEAAELWWVTDGNGNLLTGPFRHQDHAHRAATDLGGYEQQGLAHGEQAAARREWS